MGSCRLLLSLAGVCALPGVSCSEYEVEGVPNRNSGVNTATDATTEEAPGSTPTGDTGTAPVPEELSVRASRDALLLERDPDDNFGHRIEFSSGAWTWSHVPYRVWSVVAFELSDVPADAVDVVAVLDLYAETTSSLYLQVGHSPLTVSNASYLRRTLDPWEETTVTWNTRPGVTTDGEVLLPMSNTFDEDYLGIVVTEMVNDALASGLTEIGFMLQLEREEPYAELMFASSDHDEPLHHPRLRVRYQEPPE